jgi:hypothetical protein
MMRIFFFITAVLTLNACQPDSPNRPRTLECFVRYQEDEQKVSTEATFAQVNDNGQSVPIELKGGIRYQNMPMTLRPVQGLTYARAYPAAFQAEHNFMLEVSPGQPLTFPMTMNAMTDIGFGSPQLPLGKAARFSWHGAPLERGETVVLLWENPATHQTVPMEIYGVGLAFIELPAAKLAELQPGTWTLYAVRKKLVKANLNGIAASGIMEYYSKTDTLLLVKGGTK